MPTLHLIIKGKVQGVFYRATAKKVALELSITGWIRNNGNGDVEAMATGTESQLQKFAQWCRRGPDGAWVDNIIEKEVELEIAFVSFEIKRG